MDSRPHDIYGGNYSPRPDKFRVLYLRKDQLLGDIDASIELASLSRLGEGGVRPPIFEEPLMRMRVLFNRWINKYVDNAKQRMQAYLVGGYSRYSANANDDWMKLNIELHFPWYWDDSVFDALGNAVHDYIVNSVLHEFFVVALTSRDVLTSDKEQIAADAYDNIKHYCVSCLPGTQRKKLHPF